MAHMNGIFFKLLISTSSLCLCQFYGLSYSVFLSYPMFFTYLFYLTEKTHDTYGTFCHVSVNYAISKLYVLCLDVFTCKSI